MTYSRKTLLVLSLLGLVLFTLISVPIDLWVAKLPYNSSTHKFYGEVAWWCQIIYAMVPITTVVLITGSLSGIFFSKKINAVKAHSIKKASLIILLSLALGPGILANSIFKNHWGRPRPYQVIRDGKTFAPVWQVHLNKEADNSFPSGHATIGFFLGIPFLALGRRRKAIIVSVCGGLVVGLVRILQGGHYFSDVVFAGIIVWLSAELVLYFVNVLDRKGILGE